MRKGYGRAILAVGSVLILPASVWGAGPGQSSVAPPPAGAAILTEQSVWRTHVTWGKILMQGGAGLKEWGAWWAQLKAAQSSLPPEDWRQPGFDDSSWGLWRETHVPNTLKTKDGADTGVRVYDEWQYGIQLSTFMALRCLRGKAHDFYLWQDPPPR